jgi:serine/threonine-protein kinase
MPFVEDETLRDRLEREKQLQVDEAVRIARSVAGALQAAHEAGVIHRDIKPENILLSRGEPLVSDFGIALAVSHAGGGRLTETGLSLGTPYYMSPEQATADRDPGQASDVYSLGCVLYEMLVGDPPHTGSSAQAVLAKILTEEPRAVTALRRTVPPHVADATARALERLPADRFESAEAFSRALADAGFRHTLPGTAPAGVTGVHGGEDVVEAPAGTGTSRPAARALPWMVAALASVMAVLGWLRDGGSASSGPTELLMDPGVDSLVFNSYLGVSPDGRTFALSTREGRESPLYVRTGANAEWRVLPGTEGGYWPAFSPNGDRIAYVTEEAELMAVSVAGGSPLTLYDPGDDLYEPHWGANGDIVVSTDDGIRRVRSGGGVDTLSIEGTIYWPFMLPDGSGVLYAEGSFSETSVWILDLDTDSTRLLLDEGNRPMYLESGHILFAHPDGGLQVVPFDLGSRTVTGAPVPVRDGIQHRGFSVSANGTLVYRSGLGNFSGSESRFLRVGFDGSVDTLRLPERDQGQVQISPDGSRFAFTVWSDEGDQAQIYTYDLARRTGPTQLTFDGDRNLAPVWSPDGTRIAYRHDGSDILVKAVDGGAPATTLLDDSVAVEPQAWTTSGGLVLQRAGEGGVDLYRMPAPDSSAVAVEFLRTDFRETFARVSPDGRWVAYVSFETGQAEVFVRSYPDALGPWRLSRGVGFDPQWSADGRAVLFFRPGNGVASILSVDVELEPTFVARDPVEVWSGRGRDFDVHPDGQHLVVVDRILDDASDEDDEDEPSQVVVVLNWFEELRARLGEGN